MPIDLKEYRDIQEKELKSNKALLEWMDPKEAYTTTEVQEFLGIHHPAAYDDYQNRYNPYFRYSSGGFSLCLFTH